MTSGSIVHLQMVNMDILSAIDIIHDKIYVLEKMYQESIHLESMIEVSNKNSSIFGTFSTKFAF